MYFRSLFVAHKSFLRTYLRSFQYEVLIPLIKIGYIPSPNCSFCQDTKETGNHVLLVPFRTLWMLLPTFLNVVIGILKWMDLVNYVIMLQSWTKVLTHLSKTNTFYRRSSVILKSIFFVDSQHPLSPFSMLQYAPWTL